MPIASARLATALLPTRSSARIAGMFSDCWSASRTRTGPRSRRSASRGAQFRPRVELGRDVEQQTARREVPLLERCRVDDRLARRTRLPVPVASDVVLGFEALRGEVVAVVPGAADVGEHVAGPVVERHERGVVEVLAAQRPDPATFAARDLELLEQLVAGAALEVRGDDGGSDPTLCQLLCPPVERGDDSIAGRREIDVLRRRSACELALDLPREMAGPEPVGLIACEDDGFVERGLQLERRQLGPARGGQVAQHIVPAHDRRRVGGHDQVAGLVLLGVGIRIERARRLGERGEQRRLGRRQAGEILDPEVGLCRGGDPVCLVPVVDLVEVRRDDAFLADHAGVRLVEAHRLDDLLGLPDVAIGAGRHHVLREHPRADELLGDRRCPALTLAARVLRDRGQDRLGVEAAVLPERAVLRGGRRVEDQPWHVVVGDDAPLDRLEATQLDLAVAVVEDRRLGERQRLELGRVGQVLGQIGDGGRGGERRRPRRPRRWRRGPRPGRSPGTCRGGSAAAASGCGASRAS